jgi:hypothetical protein
MTQMGHNRSISSAGAQSYTTRFPLSRERRQERYALGFLIHPVGYWARLGRSALRFGFLRHAVPDDRADRN